MGRRWRRVRSAFAKALRPDLDPASGPWDSDYLDFEAPGDRDGHRPKASDDRSRPAPRRNGAVPPLDAT